MARIENIPVLKNLLILIKDGSTSDVKTYLETHDPFDEELKWDGLSALGYAVSKRRVKVVKMLLNFGANVNVRGDGYELGMRPFQYLYIKVTDPDERPLSGVRNIFHRNRSSQKSLVIADLLVKAGASLDVETDSEHKFKMKYSLIYPPLIYAAMTNDIPFAKFLLDNGVDVDCRKYIFKETYISKEFSTPLYYAAKNGCMEMVELLLSNGANINLEYGIHPLVGSSDNVEMTELLLSHGAQPTQVSYLYFWPFLSNTPFMHTLMHGDLNCAVAMMKYKIAFPEFPDTPGEVLVNLRQCRTFISFGSIRILIYLCNNYLDHQNFGERAFMLGSKHPDDYCLFPALLDAGVDLLKCENIEDILIKLSRNVLPLSIDNGASLHMTVLLMKLFREHGVKISNYKRLMNEMQMLGIETQRLSLHLYKHPCTPLTLEGLCRIKVRQECSTAVSPTQGLRSIVEQLHLPKNVKNYLLFSEIWDEMEKIWTFCKQCESITLGRNSVCKCQKVKSSRCDGYKDIGSGVTNEFESDLENQEDTDEEESCEDLQFDKELMCRSADYGYRYGIVL